MSRGKGTWPPWEQAHHWVSSLPSSRCVGSWDLSLVGQLYWAGVSSPRSGTSAPPQRQRPQSCFEPVKPLMPCWNWLKDTFKEEFGVRDDLCKIINGATWLFMEEEIKLDSRQSLLVHRAQLWWIAAFMGHRITCARTFTRPSLKAHFWPLSASLWMGTSGSKNDWNLIWD